MKSEELLTMFEIHANGKIGIFHNPADPKLFSTDITLGDLYRMFKLKLEKEYESVHMD